MKIAINLAIRNLFGAGLRTWLNVSVLAFALIAIIFFNGLIDGWNKQALHDGIHWEYGNGHLRNNKFDPDDPFTFEEGHASINRLETNEEVVPVLICQASIFPKGRMIPIQLKGIPTNQNAVDLPTSMLRSNKHELNAIIGKRMASSNNLQIGDKFVMRWKDKNGTIDAREIHIAHIFKTNVPSVDQGQIWMDYQNVNQLFNLDNHASYILTPKSYVDKSISGWTFFSQDQLLSKIKELIEMERTSSSFIYLIILGVGLLALFDTQVLSVFRRQKEIGTYIAMGMTRPQVLGIFTVEGAMYSIFGSALGLLFGSPIFTYVHEVGISMKEKGQDIGVILAERIYPEFSVSLILGSVLFLVISATLVSFLPARKIVKMDAVDAIRGKIQ